MKNLIPLMLILSLCAFAACSSAKKASAPADAAQEKPSASAQQESVIKGSLDKNGKVVITGINYDKGSAEIPEESEGKIKELADYLKENTSVSMNVSCYTDADGSPAYCVDLSKKRAQNISEKLKGYGVEESRITHSGEGWKPGELPEEQGERMEIELVH